MLWAGLSLLVCVRDRDGIVQIPRLICADQRVKLGSLFIKVLACGCDSGKMGLNMVHVPFAMNLYWFHIIGLSVPKGKEMIAYCMFQLHVHVNCFI